MACGSGAAYASDVEQPTLRGRADLSQAHISPLYGDLSGFPPTFLQSGTRDLFLSNTVRMHRALRRAGVSAELHIFEAMPHGGFGAEPRKTLSSNTKSAASCNCDGRSRMHKKQPRLRPTGGIKIEPIPKEPRGRPWLM
ncbi:alpha/beta hydrolase [Sphingobium scionense]